MEEAVRNIKIDYAPYDKQLRFHESTAKFRAFIGGLGSGKSAAGSVESIITMLNYPDTLGAILAPTYPMMRDSTQRAFFKFCPQEIISTFNRSMNELRSVNGSEVLFRTCDDPIQIDRLRNIELSWFWIDEGALIPEYAWRVLVGRLRQKGGPLRGWITTTPKGFGWIYHKFPNSKSKDYEYFHATTAENLYLPTGYLETLKSEYTGIFAKQEIMGEFVGFEGLVYPAFSRNIHVIDTGKVEFKDWICGVDFGFTNPSTILKIGFDHDGRAYITKEFYQTHVTDAELAEHAKKDFGQVEYSADSSNPGGIEEFKKLEMICSGAAKITGEREESFVLSGIKAITALLDNQDDGRPRLFVDRRCVNTIMEFENYRYPDTKENAPVKEAPLKIHDHAMDALRYALVSRKKPLAFAFV